ncbi:MAG: radical SAM family heme chaperone HemW [Clostridia bacterium]|nr:radical SAM family heme chaperone HemW [Clostridia bacterium]
MNAAFSVYIHIPFCVKKCAYCDFASYGGCMEQMGAYVDAVCREIRAQAALFGKRRVKTVFFGGGTPTLMTGEQVQRVMDALGTHFYIEETAEITMEGNPGTLTAERLRAYQAAGVNRLSIGVQSMDDGLLAAIGRIHTTAQAVQAVRLAREAGFDNLNLDLMYGLPGQTAQIWRETLEAALALAPEHLSCYSLILEEGTPLCAAVRAGTCAPLPDEEEMDAMDALTAKLLDAAGYTRYEVSNWAKPGRQCRHNIVYWECEPYLGVGAAAHGEVDGMRFEHTADIGEYIKNCENPACLNRPEGNNTREDRMFERAMMGLRMICGMDAQRFAQDFGQEPQTVWQRTIPQMIRDGLMVMTKERLALTRRGMDVMNGVLTRMMEEFPGD